jgi:hypothetical protein
MENKSIVEQMEEGDSEWEKEHPISNWIDKQFPNESLCGYRASYTLTHPWIFIKEGTSQIRWAWQRVFVGYDERVIWSIDLYLAKMIPLWLKELKDGKHGCPMICFRDCELSSVDGTSEKSQKRARKEYENILANIIEGFEAYEKSNGDFFFDKKKEKLFKNAMSLFVEYFGTFWS